MYDLLQIFPMPGGSIITPTISAVTHNRKNNGAASTSNNSNTSSNGELIDTNDKRKSTTDNNSLIGKFQHLNPPIPSHTRNL